MFAARVSGDSLAVLICGLFFLGKSVKDMGTGSATLFYRDVARSEGYRYRCALWMGWIFGIGGLVLFAAMVRAPQLVLIAGIPRDCWSMLLMGVFFLLTSARNLHTGNATLIYSDVTRSENGFRYWCAIGIGLMFAIGCLAGFVWRLVS